VLLDISLFDDKENWFGPEFGRTGGEDIEFFKKRWADAKYLYGAIRLLHMKRLRLKDGQNPFTS